MRWLEAFLDKCIIFIDFRKITNTLPPIDLIGRVARDDTFFRIFNVWDIFILKKYSLLIWSWNLTEVSWVCLIVVVFIVIVCSILLPFFFQNLTTLPIDLYGSTSWEPLILFITRITKHKQHFVLSGRKDYILMELSPRFKTNKSPG